MDQTNGYHERWRRDRADKVEPLLNEPDAKLGRMIKDAINAQLYADSEDQITRAGREFLNLFPLIRQWMEDPR